jgi:fibroblast growth factor receptor 1
MSNVVDPGHLKIPNATMEDAGRYTCVAGNSIGISHRSAWLEVLPKDSRPPNLHNFSIPFYSFLYDGTTTFYIFWVLVVILVCVIAVVVTFSYLQQRKSKEKERMLQTMNGDVLSGLHPIKRKVTIMRPNILYHSYFEKGMDPNHPNGTMSSNGSASLPLMAFPRSRLSSELSALPEYELPLDPAWEVYRDRLELGTALGEGAFGQVYKAEAQNLGKEATECI